MKNSRTLVYVDPVTGCVTTCHPREKGDGSVARPK